MSGHAPRLSVSAVTAFDDCTSLLDIWIILRFPSIIAANTASTVACFFNVISIAIHDHIIFAMSERACCNASPPSPAAFTVRWPAPTTTFLAGSIALLWPYASTQS